MRAAFTDTRELTRKLASKRNWARLVPESAIVDVLQRVMACSIHHLCHLKHRSLQWVSRHAQTGSDVPVSRTIHRAPAIHPSAPSAAKNYP